MSTNVVFLTIKVPAEHQAEANALAATFDYDTGGGETFNTGGYSASGNEPAEFYIRRIAVRPYAAAQLAEATLPTGVVIEEDQTIEEAAGGLLLVAKG